jgi:hypothetical protein
MPADAMRHQEKLDVNQKGFLYKMRALLEQRGVL